MTWRHYLLLLAFNGVLIGLAMGLHYGHLHHETEEPAAVASADEIAPWPAAMKDQMIAGCATQGMDREQCACTFEWWEQNASLSDYLDWSNAMALGRPVSDEVAQLFVRSGSACIR